MPKNLEIKVKLDSHKGIKKILSLNNIRLKEVLNQKDIYYRTGRGILKLRIEEGSHTLIFYNRDEKSKKRWSDYQLFKFGETNPDNFLKRFLDVLVTVNKKRELYIYKNTRIHLDMVKNSGAFLELETRVIKGLKDAEIRFNFLLDLLKLRDKKEIRSSYKDILLGRKK